MNVLYCGDSNVEDGVAISVLSLLPHVEEPLHVFILTASITVAEKRYVPVSSEFAHKLEAKMKERDSEHTLMLLDATDRFEAAPPIANLDTRFTPCCMLRLYADQLGCLPSRILYLDCDVVCRGDISQMARWDMDGHEIGGVLDYYGRWLFRQRIAHLDYLNSGVLLMNLDEIARTGLLARCREMCASEKMFMPDQSALNKLAVSKLIMPRCYNEQRKLQDDTVLQHFSTSFRVFPVPKVVTVKPWQPDRMHTVLKLHEYDDVLEAYARFASSADAQKNYDEIGDVA